MVPRARRRVPGISSVLRAAFAVLLCAAGTAAAAPPSPAEVVKLTGSLEAATDGGLVARVTADIKPGFHINAHEPGADHLIPTTLTLDAPGLRAEAPEYPQPVSREFEFSPGEPLLVYDGRVEIRARVEEPPAGAVRARLRFQACDDTRCLPPATVEATLAAEQKAGGDAALTTGAGAETDGSGWIARWLEHASLPAALAFALVLGLTLNLTPCVYPLISVTIAYFGSQSRPGSRPWPLATAYVVGISASFAVLGLSAALFGGLVGAPLQHPAVLIGIAGLFLVLAASSFGMFEIRAPSALVQRFGGSSTGIGGALLMGLTMGIVAAPCIGPVIVGLLVYVGAKQDLLLGLALFLAMGIGMGVPYVFLASAAGSITRLPRSGQWLRWVNRLFGVLLVGMAIYFVSPLVNERVLRILVPLYLAAGGVYLGFLEGSARALRSFAVARGTLGVALIVAAVWVAVFDAKPDAQARDQIRWESLSVGALDRAIASRRPAIVEFGADWCLPCVAMAKTTFVDADVARESERFSMLKADVTESTPANDALLGQFQVLGVPTIIFYDGAGEEVDRVVGYVDAQRFAAMMRKVAGPPARGRAQDGNRGGGRGGRGDPEDDPEEDPAPPPARLTALGASPPPVE